MTAPLAGRLAELGLGLPMPNPALEARLANRELLTSSWGMIQPSPAGASGITFLVVSAWRDGDLVLPVLHGVEADAGQLALWAGDLMAPRGWRMAVKPVAPLLRAARFSGLLTVRVLLRQAAPTTLLSMTTSSGDPAVTAVGVLVGDELEDLAHALDPEARRRVSELPIPRRRVAVVSRGRGSLLGAHEWAWPNDEAIDVGLAGESLEPVAREVSGLARKHGVRPSSRFSTGTLRACARTLLRRRLAPEVGAMLAGAEG